MYIYLNIFISSLMFTIFCTKLILFPIKRWKIPVMFVVVYSFALLAYFVLESAIVTPLILCILVSITAIKEPHPFINIIHALLGYLIGCFIIYGFSVLALPLYDYNETPFRSYSTAPTIPEFFCNLIPLFLSILVLHSMQYFMKKHLDFVLKYVYTRQTCFIMTISFLVCGLAYSIANAYADILHYNNMVFFMCVVIIFLVLLLVSVLSFGIIRSIMDKYRAQLKEENYQLLQNYVKDLETEYLQIRGFKHDFTNVFVSMYGYMEQEDMAGLKNFYEKHLIPLRESIHSDHAQLAVLSRIQSEELKSLLYGKLSHALYCQLHVSVELRQAVVLPDWVNLIDLNRALGIFLDNAIEASLDSEEKTLQLGIVVESDHLCFLIANSCLPLCCDIEKIFSLNYSTKGSYRGMGLYQAKKLLDKDERFLLITNLKETTFLQQLEIYYN